MRASRCLFAFDLQWNYAQKGAEKGCSKTLHTRSVARRCLEHLRHRQGQLDVCESELSGSKPVEVAMLGTRNGSERLLKCEAGAGSSLNEGKEMAGS